MSSFEIVGFLSISIIVIIAAYKAYRYCFGYDYNTCPNNHDTMSRSGSLSVCNKCGTEL